MIKENLQHRGKNIYPDKLPSARSEHAGTVVKIVDYDPAKHLVKVVKKSDNQPLDQDIQVDVESEHKKAFEHPNAKTLKTSQAADGPIVEVDDNVASIRGNADYGFFSYREGGGNIIKGPLSIATEPHQIRIAGLTTLNPLITSGFASTIVTPIPTCVHALPTASIIKPILKDVLVAGTILAAAGSSI